MTFDFYWSPEGRKVATIIADTEARARATFKREYRSTYGKFMGEVYVIHDFVYIQNSNYYGVTSVCAICGKTEQEHTR